MNATTISPEIEERLSMCLRRCEVEDLVHETSSFWRCELNRHAGAKLISTDGSTRLLVTFRGDGVRVAASRPISQRATIRSLEDMEAHVESLRRLSLALERMINRADQ